jgi:hypothetical protein
VNERTVKIWQFAREDELDRLPGAASEVARMRSSTDDPTWPARSWGGVRTCLPRTRHTSSSISETSRRSEAGSKPTYDLNRRGCDCG